MLGEFCALPKPSQRLGRLTELRQRQGGASNSTRKLEADAPPPHHRDPTLEQ